MLSFCFNSTESRHVECRLRQHNPVFPQLRGRAIFFPAADYGRFEPP